MNNIDQAKQIAGLYCRGGDWQKALDLIEQALRCSPDDAELLNNRAICLNALARIDEAISAARAAAEIAPSPATLSTLGLCLERGNQLDEAIAAHHAAYLLAPDDPAIVTNLGNAHQSARHFEAAACCYHMALGHDARNPGVLCNLGYNAFLQGNYAEGWSLYENRLRHYPPMIEYLERYDVAKLWHGEGNLCGKTVAVFGEQGYGDVLWFCRYVPLLKERYPEAEIVFDVPPSLVGLMEQQRTMQRIEIVSGRPDTYDYHVPLLSLPHLLRTPTHGGEAYIKAKRKKQLPKGINIGCAYRGSRQHPNDLARSAPAALFDQFRVEGVRLWSLQQGEDFGPLDDWTETASIIAALDAVVSVDTSVLHLAAAMGKPTFGIIAYRPDPRWTVEGSSSPWYSSLSLHRQSSPGDWSSAFASAASGLGGWITSMMAQGTKRYRGIRMTCV